MTATASTPADSTTRVAWLAHRNAHLTRQNGALQDQNQQLIQLLAGVALVAGNMHPGVAREIVAIVEEVTLTEPGNAQGNIRAQPDAARGVQRGRTAIAGESPVPGSASVIPHDQLLALLGGP